jgi:CRP/FNR family cyclic AMP-dependent transcriptional regulator
MDIDFAAIEIFRDLPVEITNEIKGSSQLKHVLSDTPILWAGMECAAVYFIVSGCVDISRLSGQGREQVLERLGPGEAFNLVPIFLGKPLNPADAKAVGPADLLVIGREDFLRLLDHYPALMRALAAYLAKRLLSMVGLAERLALFPVRQHLAAFLINQADTIGEDVARYWTQEDIARRLGTVRDVVGRALRKFEQEGLIRFQREHIQLLDREKLQDLADGRE